MIFPAGPGSPVRRLADAGRVENVPRADSPGIGSNPNQFGQQDELSATYELFTGGRAISENLQFERDLPVRGANETPVKIDSLQGVTIAEIDWKPLIKDAQAGTRSAG